MAGSISGAPPNSLVRIIPAIQSQTSLRSFDAFAHVRECDHGFGVGNAARQGAIKRSQLRGKGRLVHQAREAIADSVRSSPVRSAFRAGHGAQQQLATIILVVPAVSYLVAALRGRRHSRRCLAPSAFAADLNACVVECLRAMLKLRDGSRSCKKLVR